MRSRTGCALSLAASFLLLSTGAHANDQEEKDLSQYEGIYQVETHHSCYIPFYGKSITVRTWEKARVQFFDTCDGNFTLSAEDDAWNRVSDLEDADGCFFVQYAKQSHYGDYEEESFDDATGFGIWTFGFPVAQTNLLDGMRIQDNFEWRYRGLNQCISDLQGALLKPYYGGYGDPREGTSVHGWANSWCNPPNFAIAVAAANGSSDGDEDKGEDSSAVSAACNTTWEATWKKPLRDDAPPPPE